VNKARKKQLLGNLRTPLPKKTERVHKDKRKYNRKEKEPLNETNETEFHSDPPPRQR